MIFDFMISASLTTDIVFIIYSKQHNLETQDIASSQSAKSYLKKWFTVDLLAALPVEITALVSGKWNLYLRPLRLIRVIRLTRIFKYTAMIRGYTRRRRIKCCKLEEGKFSIIGRNQAHSIHYRIDTALDSSGSLHVVSLCQTIPIQ